MIISDEKLNRLQALARKAADDGSSDEERSTSAMMLVRELRKVGFFEATKMAFDEEAPLPPRRPGTVVDSPPPYPRRRSQGPTRISFDPPEFGKKNGPRFR